MRNRPTPRENAKRTLDQPQLAALALHYVGRYATTQVKLRRYLERKLRERDWNGAQVADIDAVITKCVAYGYVDDQSFAVARAAALSRRGYGAARVNGALRQAGIDAHASLDISALSHEEAMAAALRFAKRKSIGPFSRVEVNQKARDRMMSALIRAGHSFDVARAIMVLGADDGADESGWP
jgi:regulatory protein